MNAQDSYVLIRFIFEKLLGLIYFFSFLVEFRQFVPLCGSRGILPAEKYLRENSVWNSPTLFRVFGSDAAMRATAALGIAGSLLLISGVADMFGVWGAAAVYFVLWCFHLSFMNAGQGLHQNVGWEFLLSEAGFVAIFMGAANSQIPVPVVWMFRAILFSAMFFAGLAKFVAGSEWRNLSAMDHFYETLPFPSSLAWRLHRLPRWFHRISTALTLVIELPLPFFYFLPPPFSYAAGALTIFFQMLITASGNFGWYNHLTMFLAVWCFDDGFIEKVFGVAPPSSSSGPTLPFWILAAGAVIWLVSRFIATYDTFVGVFRRGKPIPKFLASLKLDAAYVMFAHVNPFRRKIVIEGKFGDTWTEYKFKGALNHLDKMPRYTAPYFQRLSLALEGNQALNEPFFPALLVKLLEGGETLKSLMEPGTLPPRAPSEIRVSIYRGKYNPEPAGDLWKREKVRDVLPSFSLKDTV